MKRKLKGFIGALVLLPLVSFAIFYLFVSFYYTEGFTFNTRINGVYCTGKSVSEVNDELVALTAGKSIVVKSAEYGTEEEILLSDIDYTVDYTKALNDVFGKQNPFLWIFNASQSSITQKVEPVVLYDSDKLNERIRNLNLVKDHTDNVEFVSEIRYSKDDGYYLYEHSDEVIDLDSLINLTDECIKGDLVVDVPKECFFVQDETPYMLHEKKSWADVSGFLTQKITYDMGDEQIKIGCSILSDFVVYNEDTREFLTNDDGSLYINKEAVEAYIDSLCDRYDTYGVAREFVAHSGEVKTIKFSIYGTLLDRKAEKDYLYNALLTGEEGVHKPKYIHEPFHRGLNDIGDTYVEVDMTKQVLYYIQNGEVKLFCDVVTGKPSAGYSTPEMVCYVYKKVPGKYLRGEDYCSYVNFWMPVYKAIGLHDASWQSAFGGDRYLRHGSRGCINMRYDDAKTLYDSIEIGTPVLVYK